MFRYNSYTLSKDSKEDKYDKNILSLFLRSSALFKYCPTNVFSGYSLDGPSLVVFTDEENFRLFSKLILYLSIMITHTLVWDFCGKYPNFHLIGIAFS